MATTDATSRLSATITIFACTISGGLLTLPSVFASTSLLVSLLIVLFSAVTTFSSLLTLIVMGEMTNSWSYGQLVGSVFGRRSKLAINLLIGFFLVGVIGGSFIVVHDYTTQTFATKGVASVATLLTALLVMLLSLPQKMGALSLGASFSMFSFCFLVFTLVYYATVEISSGALNNSNITIPWWAPASDGPSVENEVEQRFASIGTAVPIILYAFGCQIQIFDIYDSVGKKRKRGGLRYFVPVLMGAVSLMVVLFSLVGVFGYFAFPDQKISGDVLKSLMTKGALGNVARGMLVLACVFAAPLIVNPVLVCFTPVLQLMLGYEESPRKDEHAQTTFQKWRYLLIFMIVGSAASLALSVIHFLVVVGALGAFIASPLFFILPGGMLLYSMQGNQSNRNDNGVNLTLLDDGSMEEPSDRLELSKKEKCGAMFMGLWLVVIGVLTFVLSLWKFFKK